MRSGPERRALLLASLAVLACSRSPDRAAEADSLLAPGESLYARGAFDSAAAAWNRALGVGGVAGSSAEAKLLTWLGLAAYRRGEYAEARRTGERALALKRSLGLPPFDLAESENALGLLAWNEGRLQDATLLFTAALAGYRAARDEAGIAKSSNNLALVALEFGRFAEAREGFTTARAAARAIGNARIEGRATTNLAMLELWSGDPGAAPALLAQARALADSAEDPIGQENALGQAALAWSALGQPGRALATLDSAIELARRHGLREEEANDLLALGSLHRAAGDADRAIQLYAQARSLNQELGLSVEAGTVLRQEALLRAARGAVERARADALEALRLHRAAEARLEEFHDLVALAGIEAEAGAVGAAARWLSEARSSVAALDAPQTRVTLALAEAGASARRGDPDGTLAALRAVSEGFELAGSAVAIEAEWLRTRAFAALGRLDSAVQAGRRAIQRIEQARGSFASPALRSGFTADRSGVFADLVLALLRLNQPEEAFAVADAARGRALLDHLAGARDASRGGAMGRDLAERNRLLRAIDALLARLEETQAIPRQERGPDAEATSLELAERLRLARAEYEAVLTRLAEREPTRAGLIGTRSVSLQAIRAALHADEALVQYFVTPERLILFAVTRTGVRPLEVPLPLVELENRVRLARGLLSAPNRGDSASAVLEELDRLLVAPLRAAGALGRAERLLIVPHGVLAYLPFAALRNRETGRRLIEEYSVQYLPSAAALAALRTAGLLNPRSGRTTAFAPFPGRLPATSEEAAAIARAIRGVRQVSGAAASELSLRQSLARGDVVHVATHGIMNPVNPMFSSIRVERGHGNAPDDDGRLEVHELLGMRVTSPLVFLSGCETALGGAGTTPFDRTHDYATLAQAFLYAGARGVVATLWRIDDQGAARLAERFYHHLGTRTAAEALAAAQRDLIRDPRWGHPYYWAGYTLAGDGPEPGGANRASASVSP